MKPGTVQIMYFPAVNAIMAETPAPLMRGRTVGVFQTAGAVGAALFPAAVGLENSVWSTYFWAGLACVFALGAIAFSLGNSKAAVPRLSLSSPTS